MEVSRYTYVLGGATRQLFMSPGLKILNNSPFPVTLEEAGYVLKGGGNYLLTRLDMPDQQSESGFLSSPERFPQGPEVRTSLRVAWWDNDEDNLKGKHILRAYAKTTCGTIAKVGKLDSKLRTLADELAKGSAVMKPLEDRAVVHRP